MAVCPAVPSDSAHRQDVWGRSCWAHAGPCWSARGHLAGSQPGWHRRAAEPLMGAAEGNLRLRLLVSCRPRRGGCVAPATACSHLPKRLSPSWSLLTWHAPCTTALLSPPVPVGSGHRVGGKGTRLPGHQDGGEVWRMLSLLGSADERGWWFLHQCREARHLKDPPTHTHTHIHSWPLSPSLCVWRVDLVFNSTLLGMLLETLHDGL